MAIMIAHHLHLEGMAARLDGRRRIIARLCDGAEQFVGKAEIGKVHADSVRK
jgi:hypothetical protein